MKVLHITWIDSKVASGWRDISEITMGPLECHTVGLLVHEDEVSVTLAGSWCEANQSYGESITIPKVCIRRKKILLRF